MCSRIPTPTRNNAPPTKPAPARRRDYETRKLSAKEVRALQADFAEAAAVLDTEVSLYANGVDSTLPTKLALPAERVLRPVDQQVSPKYVKPAPIQKSELVTAGVKDSPVKLIPPNTHTASSCGKVWRAKPDILPSNTVAVAGAVTAIDLVAVRFVHTTGQVIRAAFPYRLAVAAAEVLERTGQIVLGIAPADMLDLELLFRWEDKTREFAALSSSSLGVLNDTLTQFYEIHAFHALTARQAWLALRWAAEHPQAAEAAMHAENGAQAASDKDSASGVEGLAGVVPAPLYRD